MKLTLQTQLFPDAKETAMLKETIQRFNAACTWLAEKAFALKTANKVKLQQAFYYEIRKQFGLSAQMTAICIRHTAGTYSRDKSICPKFRDLAAMPYDSRIYSFKGVDRVSLLTLERRVIVPFVMGKYQAEQFTHAKGQADLVYRERDGKWFFLITVDIPDVSQIPTTDFIGVDFGITEIAATSDGDSESGSEVKRVAQKYAALRQVLQRKASKQSQNGKRPRSIRRFQKQISKRVRNFKRHSNHVISKKIVALAKDTNRGIAIEDLTHIRKRCEKRFRKARRSMFSGWSFHQLREYITYKCKLAGVMLAVVDPRDSSRECSECGHIAKENRRSQSEFECVECHFSLNADTNASRNLRSRAISNHAQKSESIALNHALQVG